MTNYGIPVPPYFIVVPILAVAGIAAAAAYLMDRYAGLSGMKLLLASIAVAELVVLLILLAIFLASYREPINAEDRISQAYLIFYLGIAWAISFVLTIPAVYFAIAFLHRR